MAAADSKVPRTIIKKVSPYPIEALVDIAGQKKPIQILKLTPDGAIARTDKILLKVGEFYSISFELPVQKTAVATRVRIVKTYDKSINPKEKLIERMAELHFEGLAHEIRGQIVAFLNAIGQNA